jgi:TRAP-type C4-dicarboxylate transport system permease small subunit
LGFFAEWISNWCFRGAVAVAGFALFFMAMLVTVDVIGREFLRPTGIAHEVSGYCLVAIVFLGLAYTLRRGRHIQITTVTSRLSPRVRRWLAIVTSGMSLAFIVWLFWFSVQHVITAYKLNSISMTPLGITLWPLQTLLPIGLLLLAIAIIGEIIKIVRPK